MVEVVVERDESRWMEGVCIDDEAIEAVDGDGCGIVTDRRSDQPPAGFSSCHAIRGPCLSLPILTCAKTTRIRIREP